MSVSLLMRRPYPQGLPVSGSGCQLGGGTFCSARHSLSMTARRRGIADVGRLDARDAVDAEMAVTLSQLAPAGDKPRLLEKADQERPDGAFGLGVIEAAIADDQLAFVANGQADHAGIDARRRQPQARHQQVGGLGALAQFDGQHRGDLAQGLAG
jgi:hypothetical protein